MMIYGDLLNWLVSDIAIFVLKRDGKLQLTNLLTVELASIYVLGQVHVSVVLKIPRWICSVAEYIVVNEVTVYVILL